MQVVVPVFFFDISGFSERGIVVVAGLLPKFCLVVVDLRRTHGIVLSTHQDIA